MQYKCVIPIKGSFIFGKGHRINDIITIKQYEKLPEENKHCFVEDYSDETFEQQLERNRINDVKDENENN